MPKERRIEVCVRRNIKLDEFVFVHAETRISENIKDKDDESKVFDDLWERATDQIDAYLDTYDGGEETKETKVEVPDEGEIPGEEEGEIIEEEEEEIELSEDIINKMSKPDLVTLCETTEGLEDIDTSKKVKTLRILVIDALFEEEEEEENTESGEEEIDGDGGGDDGDDGDGEWEDDDWKDD